MPLPVKIHPTEMPGVLVIEAGRVGDDRGFFSEIWSETVFAEQGFRERFVQDNLSRSRLGTLRGLHYQIDPHGMGKLVRCVSGSMFDVAVDLRRGSPTFGRWFGRELSAENGLALWVPIGFAHGFLSLEDDCLVHYKCSSTHEPRAERAIHWADPAIGIEWPFQPSIVSPKDAAAPPLAEAEHAFSFSN